MALLWLFAAFNCGAQQIDLPKLNVNDSLTTAKEMPLLAVNILSKYKDTSDRKTYLNNLFRLQILAGKYMDAILSIKSLREISSADDPKFAHLLYVQHELFAQAKLKQTSSKASFKTMYVMLFNTLFIKTTNKEAYHIYTAFITRKGIDELKNDFKRSFTAALQNNNMGLKEAIELCKSFYTLQLYQNIEQLSKQLIKDDENRRYIIQQVLIKTKDGTTISAVVVRLKGITIPQPAILQYTIYADSANLRVLEPSVYGYTGIMAYTRGKAFSPDTIVPFENDGKDANDVIDWISRQNWCNGKIGMYGGSYNGFTQWAVAKHHHPALKTIVPYVAAIPGLGLPMENNVFINANYGWAFYTTDNKYLDNKTYDNQKRWNSLADNWYASGAAYRKIDSVDGTPNPWLQRWLKHPDYDKYWQHQVPYQNEYAAINIPVLTFTGYYDDGQISAMHYFQQHLKYNPNAEIYLIIGPYDHFGSQRGGVPVLRGYQVDPVALISTPDITFEWLDYILKSGQKPGLLKDKVNYEVMGANEWKHVPSIQKMANETLKLYLSNIKQGEYYSLTPDKPVMQGTLDQHVDLADRKISNNNDYYPYPIIKKELDHSNGYFFISKPFDKPTAVSGMFSGKIKATINKKDMDIGVVLYEVTVKGEYFELSYFLGRASYAIDMSKRTLLTPGIKESIPFSRSRLVSKMLGKGSRLLVVLNVNKNPFAQINYGTGKDVSDETIKDAIEPLKIKWHNDSFINIPVEE